MGHASPQIGRPPRVLCADGASLRRQPTTRALTCAISSPSAVPAKPPAAGGPVAEDDGLSGGFAAQLAVVILLRFSALHASYPRIALTSRQNCAFQVAVLLPVVSSMDDHQTSRCSPCRTSRPARAGPRYCYLLVTGPLASEARDPAREHGSAPYSKNNLRRPQALDPVRTL